MAVGPCLNPSCKSHGQPHPNCRCYSFAEGGSVDASYCSSNRPHKPDCEYFASGGSVSPAQGPEDAATAAIAHGGASMLFGKDNSPFSGAFGSKTGIGDTEGHMARYQSRIKKGSKALEESPKGLFDGNYKKHEEASPEEIERLKDYMDQGGHLGELQRNDNKPSDPLADLFPQHNIALNSAKAQASNHLNAMKPEKMQMKLPFDKDKSMTVQEKEYAKALGIAAKPMTILNSIESGRVTPSEIKHLNAMFPGVKDLLEKKITDQITKYQLEGKRPPYRIRQGLSLLMGTSLDSTTTPQSIMAAQAVFAPKAPPPGAPAPSKNKKGTATLTKASEQYQTGNQAAESRNKQ